MTDFTRMRSFNIVFSITTGASPSHTHASVISGKMLWGAARQCGIVPQDLWLGFNKWPFYQICFAFGWWICPNTTSLGHLGTPALRWLFCHVSKISVHFFPAVIGTILAGFCQWNVVVGSCRGRDGCRGPCEWLWFVAKKVLQLNLPQHGVVSSATQHEMEKHCNNPEKGILCGRQGEGKKNLPKLLEHS